MKFPNLIWVLAQCRLRRYDLCAVVRMSEASLSRRLNGMAPFLPHEKMRIAEFLGYELDFLFKEVVPPAGSRFPRPVVASHVYWDGVEDGTPGAERIDRV